MLNVHLLTDSSTKFSQPSETVVNDEPDLFEQSFDLDALEKYRESVLAQNLNSSYKGPAELDKEEIDVANKLSEVQKDYGAQTRCIKQECASGLQLLKRIRLDQERRDKLLELKLRNADRKRKWGEFDINVDSTLNFVKACQEKDVLSKMKMVEESYKQEQEYRRRMRLPFFIDLFFEIEETLFPELSEDALDLVRRVWDPTGLETEVFSEDFNVKITRHDLNTLRGLNWLNDEVINFYLSLIARRSEQQQYLPKAYAFNTFFLKNLTGQRGYASVKRWTRNVDIFSFEILLIPVHLGNHWCLAVIDMKAREINYFDSLGGTNYGALDALKDYLKNEHLDKKKSEFDLSSWSLECRAEIPRQMNGSDCGVFACCFAELSSRRLDFKFNQSVMPYFRRRMVYEICQRELLV